MKHVEIHYYDRPHACEQCEERFKRSCELKEHLLTHSTTELLPQKHDFILSQCFDEGPPVSIKTEILESSETECSDEGLPVSIKAEIPDSSETECSADEIPPVSIKAEIPDSSETECYDESPPVSIKVEIQDSSETECSDKSPPVSIKAEILDSRKTECSDESPPVIIKAEIPDSSEFDEAKPMNYDESSVEINPLLPDGKPDLSSLLTVCVSHD